MSRKSKPPERFQVTVTTADGSRNFFVYARSGTEALDTFTAAFSLGPEDRAQVKLDTDEWRTMLFEGRSTSGA
jgi:hypothetical protein